MKSKLCPYRRHCHSAGDCETCDFGEAFEKLSGKIRRLKEKNRCLTEENAMLRGRIDALEDPGGDAEPKSTEKKFYIPELTEEQKKEKERFVIHSNDFVSYCCSICGTKSGETCNFCPNCGADMRGKSDGKG